MTSEAIRKVFMEYVNENADLKIENELLKEKIVELKEELDTLKQKGE